MKGCAFLFWVLLLGMVCPSLPGQTNSPASLAPPPDVKPEVPSTNQVQVAAPPDASTPHQVKVGEVVVVLVITEGSTERKKMTPVDGLEITEWDSQTKWEMKKGVNTPTTTQTFWVKALRPGDFVVPGYDTTTFHSEGSLTATVHSHLETTKLHVLSPPPTPTPAVPRTSGSD